MGTYDESWIYKGIWGICIERPCMSIERQSLSADLHMFSKQYHWDTKGRCIALSGINDRYCAKRTR